MSFVNNKSQVLFDGDLSPGAEFVRSAQFQEFKNHKLGRRHVSVDLPNANFKRATATSAGLTSIGKQSDVATLGLQTPTIAGLLPETETNARTIRYIREKSFTNSAAAVAENGTKPEASWDLEEIDEQVRKIAVIGRVTDEFVDDFPAVRDYVNNRLRFMVLGCEDDQLLNGNGEGVNLRGILNTPGIQTQAKGSDSNLDAIHKAITKVKTVGFLFPTAIAVHPEDWEILRLMRDDTANYYSGGPFAAVDNVLWGLPVVKTTRIARGTALVGDFVRGGQIFRRQGLTFEMSNTDADNFSKNLITFRAETRLALAIYRPLAFCTVTGIA